MKPREGNAFKVRGYLLMLLLVSALANGQEAPGNDPTKPPPIPTSASTPKHDGVKKVSVGPGFELQSIIIGKTRRLALINDKLITIGDTIEGAKVLEINQNDVVLLVSGKRMTIYLFERGIWK